MGMSRRRVGLEISALLAALLTAFLLGGAADSAPSGRLGRTAGIPAARAQAPVKSGAVVPALAPPGRLSLPAGVPALGAAAPAPSASALPRAAAGPSPAAASISPAAAVSPLAAPARALPLSTLQAGAHALGASPSPEARRGVLQRLFTGGFSGLAPDPDHATSRDLSALSDAELEGHAKWWEAPLSERLAAVRLRAERGGEGARAALGRIAESHPEGGAEDYEVHRAALRELASRHGELRSLRPVSKGHAREILEALRRDKPRCLLSDYDDTLADFQKPLSAAHAAALGDARRAGVQAVIVTDRPSAPSRPGEITILDSLQGMGPEERDGLLVLSDKGLRATQLSAREGPREIWRLDIRWDAKERAALEEAQAILLKEIETQEMPPGSGTHSKLSDAGLVFFMRIRFVPGTDTPDTARMGAEVAAAARRLQALLNERGLGGYEALGRQPARDPHKNPPYVQVSKITKAVGVAHALSLAGVSGAQALILGDQFMSQGAGKPTDQHMAEGAPGALVLAVGPTADPRLDNAFLWPTRGAEGSLEILKAVGAAPSGAAR